jgi:DNA repair exonuclease SbcCD ATPase subunit/DNA repair exonuclease SbcCD nuclease subunit
MWTKLASQGDREIIHVYHISDVHIRNDERHDEYRQVFGRLINKIKQDTLSTRQSSVAVITGDIFEVKVELRPEAIQLAIHLFRNLSEMIPVFIIAGNHDCNPNNPKRLDSITPIVEDLNRSHNVYYLKRSGVYEFHNLVFGVSSVIDNIFIDSSQISEDLLTVLNKKYDNVHKVALYHGPVHKEMTDVGARMNKEELTINNFKGYDYGFFGDIHRFQYLNPEKTMAYAGSLIQQSFKEKPEYHGYIKWNLFLGESEHVQIENDYGFFEVSVVDGKMDDTVLSNKPRIKFIVDGTDSPEIETILEDLEKDHIIQEVSKKSIKRKHKYPTVIIDAKEKNLNRNEVQIEMLKAYLMKKDTRPEKIEELVELHNKIRSEISEERFQEIDIGQYWKIISLKFENLLSYEEGNVIYFDRYEPGNTIGILAPNAYGKSAILDILLFCLFDKFSRGDRRDIMNKKKNSFYCSLVFYIGSYYYKIERVGKRGSDKTSVSVTVNFSRTQGDTEENLNGATVHETNRRISALMGDYNDYLATCFCLQGRNTSLIDLGQAERKDFLFHLLRLNAFDVCFNMAKNKIQELNAKVAVIKKPGEEFSVKTIRQTILDLTLELKCTQEVIGDIKKTITTLEPKELEAPSVPVGAEDIDDWDEVFELIKNNEVPIDNIDELKQKEAELEANEKIQLNTLVDISRSLPNIKPEECRQEIERLTAEVGQYDYDKTLTLLDETENLLASLSPSVSVEKNTDIMNKYLELQTKTIKLIDRRQEICPDLEDEQTYYRIQGRLELMEELQVKMKSKGGVDWLNVWIETQTISYQKVLKKGWKSDEYIQIVADIEKNMREIPLLGDKLNQHVSHTFHNKLRETLTREITELRKIATDMANLKRYQDSIDKLERSEQLKKQLEEILVAKYQLRVALEKQMTKKASLDPRKALMYLEKKKRYQEQRELNKAQAEGIKRLNLQLLDAIQIEARLTEQIKVYQGKMEDAIRKTKEIEILVDQINLYSMYQDIMHPTGLPYDILRSHIPQIESDINEILKVLVPFRVNFLFSQDSNKQLGIKVKNGAIDINIVYSGQVPRNVLLGSGYEKFVVGIAIRMVLSKISLSAKPNILVVDEGWSCLDQEHLANISKIMNFLRQEYDHVIIISHLEQLKAEADYIISISKEDGVSRIDTEKKKRSYKMTEVV